MERLENNDEGTKKIGLSPERQILLNKLMKEYGDLERMETEARAELDKFK